MRKAVFLACLAIFTPGLAVAEEAVMNGSNTAWILTSTALVLFMTLPGLALFYGGLVRTKNVLSVLMQCFHHCRCLFRTLAGRWLQSGIWRGKQLDWRLQ